MFFDGLTLCNVLGPGGFEWNVERIEGSAEEAVSSRLYLQLLAQTSASAVAWQGRPA